jgi:hypothetical protein
MVTGPVSLRLAWPLRWPLLNLVALPAPDLFQPLVSLSKSPLLMASSAGLSVKVMDVTLVSPATDALIGGGEP